MQGVGRFTGFSLIESLYYLVILSVLLCAFFVYDVSLFDKNQEDILIQTLKDAISSAKVMSVIHHHPMLLSGLPPTQNWSEGIVLYQDTPNHHLQNIRDALFVWKFRKGIHLKWKGFRSKQWIIFSPNFLDASANGTFTFSVGKRKAIQIILNRHGVLKIDRQFLTR